MLKILRAVQADLCQAEADEILVPNPIFMADEDNDYFIGVRSRRPVRYGRVVEADEDLDTLVAADRAGVLGGLSEEEEEDEEAQEEQEERIDDIRFMLEFVQDIEVGTLVGCRYELDDDGLNWEMEEVDRSVLS